MAISDLVYPSDIARAPENCNCGIGSSSSSGHSADCNCGQIGYIIPPPPPIDPTRYPYPPPFWPPFPPLPPKPDDDGEVVPNNIEKKICKKSKEAATLRQLIENLEIKNKDLIIKSGSVSYSMGAYKKTDPLDPEVEIIDENIETVIEILKSKLESVKEEIKELSEQLGE